MKDQVLFDVAVIGGGPAGMMAAGRAAQDGASVMLLEKNHGLGKKLLITGGGRCNVTNNKTDVRTMLGQYKGNDKFLFTTFDKFGVAEALDFFHKHGMPTKVENEGRVFPVSNSAQSVWDVLVEYCKQGNVKIQTNSAVLGICVEKAIGHFVIKTKKGMVTAKKCIVATGGTSRPETGSTGEGFDWLKKLGHKIITTNVALVPIALKDAWAKNLGGVTLSEIKLSTFQNGQRQRIDKGKLLFTHFGISGPTVLQMSQEIGEYLQYGKVTINLDMFPAINDGELKKKLHNLLTKVSNKLIKNTLRFLVPAALSATLLVLAQISGETPNHSVSKEERKRLLALLKNLPLHVSGLLGKDKAVVSSGGVDVRDVNFATMESRIIPGLYLIGDVLNIDRPSGGYSLQLCWSTGNVAGVGTEQIDIDPT